MGLLANRTVLSRLASAPTGNAAPDKPRIGTKILQSFHRPVAKKELEFRGNGPITPTPVRVGG